MREQLLPASPTAFHHACRLCRGSLQIRNLKTNELTDLPINGLFFAIGHEPATKFLAGQVGVGPNEWRGMGFPVGTW